MKTRHTILGLCLLLSSLFSLAALAQSGADDADTPNATPTAAVEIVDDEVSEQMDDEGCSLLVRSAIDLTERSCEMVGSNQVCYGHSTLQAASRPGIRSFNFEQPGDIEDVITMQSLSLSAMDAARQIWGVVLMNVQARMETNEQVDVTFIVFGDTALESRVTLVEVITLEDVRLRSGPSTSTQSLDVVLRGETVIANGRTEDGEWLRVRLPGRIFENGWMFAALVEPVDGELESLDVVDAESDDSLVRYGPMQAFYFESGRDDSPCPQAPSSGMLIQTPEGEASVTLLIDEVIIELDATVYLQAEPNGELTVNVLEGQARVTAQGETVTAVAGTRVSVALDEDLAAADVPSEPEAYDLDDLRALPTTLLPRTVEVAPPLTLDAGTPAPGNWRFAWGVSELTCPDGTVFRFESSGTPSGLQVVGSGEALVWGGGTFNRTAAGVYTRAYIDDNSNLIQDTLRVQGFDRISGESVVDVATTVCTLNVPFTLTRVG